MIIEMDINEDGFGCLLSFAVVLVSVIILYCVNMSLHIVQYLKLLKSVDSPIESHDCKH